MKGKNKSLMLDSKKKGKKKDPHTAKWKRCFKKVSKEETDETAAKICTDSVGYEESFKERSKHESIDENKIVSLIKDKENARMSKKGLLEYIKTKKVVKTTSKRGMVSEAWGTNKELGNHMRYFKGEKGAIQKVMKYLEMIRESGVENMFGASPILNWTKDDLERYLYGKKMDLVSLEDKIEGLEYDIDSGEDNTLYETELDLLKKQLRTVEYLLDNKQEIRDILIRVALRKSDELDNYDVNMIQRHFEKAAKEAFLIWIRVNSI